MLGYLPAPIIYGVANELSGKKNSRLGMTLLMYTQSLFILFTALAAMVDRPSTVEDEENENEMDNNSYNNELESFNL